MAYKGLRFGEGGDFTENFLMKHAFQIYEKLPCEAQSRHFCQTAVRRSYFCPNSPCV